MACRVLSTDFVSLSRLAPPAYKVGRPVPRLGCTCSCTVKSVTLSIVSEVALTVTQKGGELAALSQNGPSGVSVGRAPMGEDKMEVIKYHDMTSREYENATTTSYTGGATWLKMPKVFGDDTIWFVATAMAPVQIRQYFWDNPGQSLRVSVHTGILPLHED